MESEILLYYRDQVQTDLALSGKRVNKAIFVDACLRISSWEQFDFTLEHNAYLIKRRA